MKGFALKLLAAACVILAMAAPGPKHSQEKAAGTAGTQTKSIGQGGYRFSIVTALVPNRSYNRADSVSWGQDWDSPQVRQIVEIEGTWKGEELSIPLSTYTDLFDLQSISLRAHGARCELYLGGGDAGGAYRAVILFNRGEAIKRTVRDDEFPDQYYEVTHYHYVHYTT